MGPLLLATRSEGKLHELRPLFADRGIEVVDLNDVGLKATDEEDSLEAFETFEENAVAKASYFHRLSGLPTVADDSGLVVEALGGAPGVRSKRWSGRRDLSGLELDEANNRLLMERLRGVEDRSACYVCAAAYVGDAAAGAEAGAGSIVTRGEVRGRVLTSSRGTGGFGYDPYFFSEELGKTFGEADRVEK